MFLLEIEGGRPSHKLLGDREEGRRRYSLYLTSSKKGGKETFSLFSQGGGEKKKKGSLFHSTRGQPAVRKGRKIL